MKKLVYLFSAAILTSVLALSCQKNIDEPVQDNPSSGITRTFTCVFPESTDTKVNLNESDGKVTWEPGDAIMIHGGTDGSEFVTVTLTADDISDNGKIATISFTGVDPYVHPSHPEYLSGYYAQYPADQVKVRSRMYYDCAFKGMTNEMLMAACNVGDSFTFYQLCGIISFSVSGTYDKVVLVGNNDEVVRYDGVYQVRVRDDGDGNGPQINYNKSGNESGDPLPVKEFEIPIVADGTTLNHIYIPAGCNFAGGFTLKFYEGGSVVKTAGSTKAINVAPGKYVKLGNITSKLKDYTAPTVSDHKSTITGATDISADQANCYVITAPGAYKFPALKGNSSESAGNVFGAEILWETYNNETTVTENSVISKVDFEDNWIYFETPTALTPGNAVIAAKDSDNKIIWSWHIWIPQTTLGTVDATSYSGFTFMDRNLGALVATAAGGDAVASVESFGLLYQWGRKDPFPGAKKPNSSSRAAMSFNTISVSGGAISMGYAISHPTVFGNVGGGDWQDTPDAGRWTKDSKTINDPCPKGYRIPYATRDSKPFWNKTNVQTAITDAGKTWEESSTGYWFRIVDGTNVLTFPFAGYIDDSTSSGSITHPYDRAAIWFLCESSDGYHLNIRVGGDHKFGSTSRARGCSVRCVVE